MENQSIDSTTRNLLTLIKNKDKLWRIIKNNFMIPSYGGGLFIPRKE